MKIIITRHHLGIKTLQKFSTYLPVCLRTVATLSRKTCSFLLFMATLIVANSAYAGIVTTDGLVAYWTADGTADDSSGNAHHGALFNGANFAPGKFGQAFSFGGNNEYVSIPHHPDLTLTTAFTISAWVKANQFSDMSGHITPIVHKDSQASGDRGYAFVVTMAGRVDTHIFQDGTDFESAGRYSDINLNLGVFHHVVSVYEGGSTPRLDTYIDGQLHNGMLDLDPTLSGIPSSFTVQSYRR